MLPFKVHHFVISRRHYVLLPKLNECQMETLARRLRNKGFSVGRTSNIVARSGRGDIHVDPAGLCWSFLDPEDHVLPAIPELLHCPKQAIPRSALAALYFKTTGSLGRLVTRMESGTVWDSLRAMGQCGLTPDEHAVALALLKGARDCPLVTDYPGDNPRPLVVGRRRYFESRADEAGAESDLRMAGERHSRNVYLPRDGLLRPRRGVQLSDLEDSLSSLGEWCFFTPQ